MNKRTKYIIGAIVAVVLIGGVFFLSGKDDDNRMGRADTNLQRYLEEQEDIMEDMMEEMEDIPETGDANLDFLYGMVPHHKSAIEMSESLLKYGGDNEEVKKAAEKIIEDQRLENEEMNKMIEEFKNNPKIDEEKEKAYLEEYEDMLDGHMSHNTNKGDTVDEAFLEGMIMHHEMAVEMSEAILRYTDNEMIKTMAEGIVEKQNTEISEMKEMLSALKD